MTLPDSITQITALGLEPTYSAREAAALLGRSYSWLDQRLRKGQFVLPDGTVVQPLRTAGGYRRFTTAMLRDIATSSYRQHWFSMEKVKLTFFELAMAHARGRLLDPELSFMSDPHFVAVEFAVAWPSNDPNSLVDALRLDRRLGPSHN